MSIWIVDDETNLAGGLKKAFEKKGYSVKCIPTIHELQEALNTEIPSLVFLDQCLPDGNGLDMLPIILKIAPRCRVVMMTAFGDSSLVVRAIRQGAYNYLDKPFPLDAAMNMVTRAFESIRLQNQAEVMMADESNLLLGSSPAMEKVSETLSKLAPYQDVTVLLTGESGTGKEVAARMIHRASNCQGEFVAVNCSAIPEALLEAELFGYAKGAYTGADSNKPGLIEVADKGTLFLDEIGDLPLSLQTKLFRFIDQRTIRPLGSTKEKKISLKLICATCLDLEKKVREESFRKDLYFRISVIPIKLPPLRERGKDILELASYFLGDCSKRMNRPLPELTEEVQEVFLSYPWPGNVRELRNMIERILILRSQADSFVRLADLPMEMLDAHPVGLVPESRVVAPGASLNDTIDRVERELITAALTKCGGNRTQAAAELGISRFSLIRRMQRYGLE
ncbi:sigma-54-dependent transcriptional regulator [Cloacibacillus porcorum]|uniref:sigma-54-dependent transcriptional regulator n=1 Tax=Cloacibacillus porcorum TaxID=1197717 RepID=UPI00248DDEBC|nr:sigma-54 dependent transcriptional regulator [Cloacibacillus porcorum]